MKKDQYGVSLTFYAVLAFVLVILGQMLLGGMLLGFVIVVQKDNWLTRQVMQAFLLSVVSGFVNLIVGMLYDLTNLTYKLPFVGKYIQQYISGFNNGAISFVDGLVELVILVFAIMGLIKVMKGAEAKLPVLNSLVNKACGSDCANAE